MPINIKPHNATCLHLRIYRVAKNIFFSITNKTLECKKLNNSILSTVDTIHIKQRFHIHHCSPKPCCWGYCAPHPNERAKPAPDLPKQLSAATGNPATFPNPGTNERSPESRKSDRPQRCQQPPREEDQKLVHQTHQTGEQSHLQPIRCRGKW